MFKNGWILLAILLLSTLVFSVRLIDPISKELSLNETNFVGTVAVGNTIEFIFSKELVDKYESIKLLTPLPPGFESQVKIEMESLKLLITVPVSANSGSYPFSIELAGPNKTDRVPLSFDVVRGVLDVSPSDSSIVLTSVNGSAAFKLFFVNNSDSDAIFTISTNLPSTWVNESAFDLTEFSKVVKVSRRGSVEKEIVVYPRLQGKKSFVAKINFEDTSKEFYFEVNASPTIKSKFESSIFGMPFYSFSLAPQYFLDGMVSFFFK